MKSRIGFYHKFSLVILFFAIVAVVCTVGSIVISVKSNKGYEDCKLTATASLGSCVKQEDGKNTLYYGVYTFVYNGKTWHFMNNTFYSDESKVPETVTIKHNAFTSNEDLKATVKYDRTFSIPFIYGAIALVLGLLFIVFWGNYTDEKTLALAKANVNNSQDVELDKVLAGEDTEEESDDVEE